MEKRRRKASLPPGYFEAIASLTIPGMAGSILYGRGGKIE
jgi:hypothetical protein